MKRALMAGLSISADCRSGATCPAEGGRVLGLAIVLSHPVQYLSPLFRQLAQGPEIDLTVLYSTLAGSLPAKDPEFAITVKRDTPLRGTTT